MHMETAVLKSISFNVSAHSRDARNANITLDFSVGVFSVSQYILVNVPNRLA